MCVYQRLVLQPLLFVCVCVTEAGYVATPIAMVQAALTILNEPDALPKKSVTIYF